MQITETYQIMTDIADQMDPAQNIDQAMLDTTLRSVNGAPVSIIPEKTRLHLIHRSEPSREKISELRQSIKDQIGRLMIEHFGEAITKALDGDDLADFAASRASHSIETRIEHRNPQQIIEHPDLPAAALTALGSLCTQIDAGELKDPDELVYISIAVTAEASDPIPETITVQLNGGNSITRAAKVETLRTIALELPVALTLSINPEYRAIEARHPITVDNVLSWETLNHKRTEYSPEVFFELHALALTHPSLAMRIYRDIWSDPHNIAR